MPFYSPNVADILRLTRRDETFLLEIEESLHAFFTLIGSRNSHKISKNTQVLANIWYYFITSIGNIQTLGEEYTGIIRLGCNNNIPSKLVKN